MANHNGGWYVGLVRSNCTGSYLYYANETWSFNSKCVPQVTIEASFTVGLLKGIIQYINSYTVENTSSSKSLLNHQSLVWVNE